MKQNFLIIAGPCVVESQEQIIRIAKQLKKIGVTHLRGGAFKLRTNPNNFQGLQDKGIEFLIEAKKVTGLPIITELLTIEQIKKYAKDIDIIQIGCRNMYNYELLKEAGKTGKTVLLKRAFSATYNEWLLASEYIKQSGNNNIILCERGIRTFETATRNTLDLQAVPYIKNNSKLPIIIDPSHAAGNTYMIKPMSLAAVVSGCDGLIIEVHDRPDESLCDKEQAISIDELKEIINKVNQIKKIIK